MGKKRIGDLAKELKVETPVLRRMVKEYLDDTMFKGKSIIWVNEKGQDMLKNILSGGNEEEPDQKVEPSDLKNLEELNNHYGIGIVQIKDIVYQHLDETMIHLDSNGKIFIDRRGQDIIDDMVAMPAIFRGQVLSECPNRKFVWVRHRERGIRVAVQIPGNLRGKLVGKMVYFIEEKHPNGIKYKWTRR